MPEIWLNCRWGRALWVYWSEYTACWP